jgi:hypothetical protein
MSREDWDVDRIALFLIFEPGTLNFLSDALAAFKERETAARPDGRQSLGQEDLAVQPQKGQTRPHHTQTQCSATSRHSSHQTGQLFRAKQRCR